VRGEPACGRGGKAKERGTVDLDSAVDLRRGRAARCALALSGGRPRAGARWASARARPATPACREIALHFL